MSYVYLLSEIGGDGYDPMWTVGFYDPNGKWHPERDTHSREEAAKRTAWLNGSGVKGVDP